MRLTVTQISLKVALEMLAFQTNRVRHKCRKLYIRNPREVRLLFQGRVRSQFLCLHSKPLSVTMPGYSGLNNSHRKLRHTYPQAFHQALAFGNLYSKSLFL